MSEHSNESVVTVVGIDLAKRSFHLYGVSARKQVFSKKLTRARLGPFVANLPPCTVAMEACGSAHHWARKFRTYGHEVRLIAPQFVKPFVKSNKNDAAMPKRSARPPSVRHMRFVAVKTVEQQDIQAIHHMRSLMVERRTAQINQIRGLLLEYGLEIPQGRRRHPAAAGDPRGRRQRAERALSRGTATRWSRSCAIDDTGRPLREQIRDARPRRHAGAASDDDPGPGAKARRPCRQRSGRIPRFSATGARWPPGSAWCRDSTPPAGARVCSASASVATPICANC